MRVYASRRAAALAHATDRQRIFLLECGRFTVYCTVSGHDGDDAKLYQEKDVRQIIRQAERTP